MSPPPFTPPSATDPTNQKGDESLLGNTSSKAVHRSRAEQAEEQAFEATSILQAYTTRLIFVSNSFVSIGVVKQSLMRNIITS